MLDLYFWSNIVLAFIVGGFWIALTTVAADRFGSKIGGFVGGLPSTVVVAFFFIGLVQSPEIASQATTVFPLVYGFTGLFLVSFAVFSKRNFAAGLVGALVLWFILSSLLVIYKFDNFAYSIIGYLIILIFSYLVLEKYLHLPSAEKSKIHYSKFQIFARGLFGGLMIAFAVFMNKVGGPIFGGIFAAFPAVFISMLIISYKSRGLDFSRTMIKPMLITGMITIVVYGIALRYLYLSSGLILGTIFSFLISMLSAYFTYQFIKKRLI